jgi:hypothetical protein
MLQQTPSVAKDKLKKTLHVTLDPGNCAGSKNLKLIHIGEE